MVKKIVQKKGNNLKNVGTANSVSIVISCKGCINKLLSAKKTSTQSEINISSNVSKEYREKS